MLLGDMQDWKPNVASIIEYASDIYPESEVVSKLVSGEVHRTNYKEVCIRSRKLAYSRWLQTRRRHRYFGA